MTYQFFLPMVPPTCTSQQKKIAMVNGKPMFYEPPDLADARAKLEAHLAGHAPPEPATDAVRLIVKWCFPCGRHKPGTYKTTRPDTDNLQKLLKDVMTKLGYWKDDALVVSEIVEKFWHDVPGIFIRVEGVGEP